MKRSPRYAPTCALHLAKQDAWHTRALRKLKADRPCHYRVTLCAVRAIQLSMCGQRDCRPGMRRAWQCPWR